MPSKQPCYICSSCCIYASNINQYHRISKYPFHSYIDPTTYIYIYFIAQFFHQPIPSITSIIDNNLFHNTTFLPNRKTTKNHVFFFSLRSIVKTAEASKSRGALQLVKRPRRRPLAWWIWGPLTGDFWWIGTQQKNKWTTWWFKVTFLGWLSDPFKGLSDLQLADEKVTLNHLV